MSTKHWVEIGVFLGQIVQAEFVEQVSPQTFIVNFNGKLMRVKNSTRKIFKPKDKIELKVSSINPLSFTLLKGARP